MRAGAARAALLLQRVSVVISHCVNASCLRSWPFALFAASYGIIRRCAAIVPRRAIVLVARRISFFLHSLSEQTQGYDVSCTTHERLHASVSRTLPAISATSGNAGGSQHPHGRTGTWRGGRGLRCVFLYILSHTYTRVDYFGASKFLRASTACVAL